MRKGKIVIIVSAVVKDRGKRILLLRRSAKNKTLKGYWQLPEGKMEFGEQPEETILREIKEELGIRATKPKFLFLRSTILSVDDQKYHLVRIVTRVNWRGKIYLDSEHDSCCWVNPRRPGDLRFVPGTREVLSLL